MAPETQSKVNESIKVVGTIYNAILLTLLTILVSVFGYWGNGVNTKLDQFGKHFDETDSKISTISEEADGNKQNIITLFIDMGNAKEDLATLKAVTPYFNNK